MDTYKGIRRKNSKEETGKIRRGKRRAREKKGERRTENGERGERRGERRERNEVV